MKSGRSYLISAIIIIAVMGALIFLALSRKTDTVQVNNNKDYDIVMALDFENYPKAPDKVLEAYNQIEKFLSGNLSEDFTNEDLKILVEKQRQLMDLELLAINPLEKHIEGYIEKNKAIEELGIRIIQIKNETPMFSNDAKRCAIAARQYWSKNTGINLIYNLKIEEPTGKWKIIGWSVNEGAPDTQEG